MLWWHILPSQKYYYSDLYIALAKLNLQYSKVHMERTYLNKRSSHSTKNTCSTKYLFISNRKWFYFFHLKVSYRIVRRSTKLFEYPRELLHLFVFHSEEKNLKSLNCFHSLCSFFRSELFKLCFSFQNVCFVSVSASSVHLEHS